MLLGNDSFSVPTQPADSQQDTIAAQRATMRPHTVASLSGFGSSGLGTLVKYWTSAHPGGKQVFVPDAEFVWKQTV